jgi:hypothetical protein
MHSYVIGGKQRKIIENIQDSKVCVIPVSFARWHERPASLKTNVSWLLVCRVCHKPELPGVIFYWRKSGEEPMCCRWITPSSICASACYCFQNPFVFNSLSAHVCTRNKTCWRKTVFSSLSMKVRWMKYSK